LKSNPLEKYQFITLQLMQQQIRTVSTNRISGEKVGEIQDETIQAQIKQALIAYFELD